MVNYTPCLKPYSHINGPKRCNSPQLLFKVCSYTRADINDITVNSSTRSVLSVHHITVEVKLCALIGYMAVSFSFVSLKPCNGSSCGH